MKLSYPELQANFLKTLVWVVMLKTIPYIICTNQKRTKIIATRYLLFVELGFHKDLIEIMIISLLWDPNPIKGPTIESLTNIV